MRVNVAKQMFAYRLLKSELKNGIIDKKKEA